MVAVLDPATLTDFHEGLFSTSAEDDGVYLITNGGAIPRTGTRVLTTLDDAQLSPLGADGVTVFDGVTFMSAPASPIVVGDTVFGGRLAGVFHGESARMFLSTGAGHRHVDFRDQWIPDGALFHANFVNGTYWPGSGPIATFDEAFTFTRVSDGTYFDSDGVLQTATSDEARFNYQRVGGLWVPRGLLIEPAATNLCLRSSAFNNASWTKTRTSVTADQIASPTGNVVADLIKEDSSNSSHLVQQAVSYTSGNYYTLSGCAKAKERSQIELLLAATAFVGQPTAMFDLTDGSLVSQSDCETYGSEDLGDGWWRVWISGLCDATTANSSQFRLADGDSANYQGDGSSGLYLAHAQAEIGTAPTSVIETLGATAARAADALSFTVPSGGGTVTYAFDDDSTQAEAVSPGVYPVPTDLDRANIQTLTVTA